MPEPLEPTCSACREPKGTCFPGPCKAYQAQLARQVERQALKPSDPAAPQTPPAPTLLAAADALLDAYRARYAKPTTGGIRADAPLRQEMGDLKIALDAFRAPKPAVLSPWQETEAAVDRSRAMKGRLGYESHPDFGKGLP